MNWIIALLVIVLLIIIGYLVWYIRKIIMYKDPLPSNYRYQHEYRQVWARLASADRAFPIWHSKLKNKFRIGDWDQGIFFFYGDENTGPREADVLLVRKGSTIIGFAVTHKNWHGNAWKVYTVCLGYLQVRSKHGKK